MNVEKRKEVTAFLIGCNTPDEFMAFKDKGDEGIAVVGPDGRKFIFSVRQLQQGETAMKLDQVRMDELEAELDKADAKREEAEIAAAEDAPTEAPATKEPAPERPAKAERKAEPQPKPPPKPRRAQKTARRKKPK